MSTIRSWKRIKEKADIFFPEDIIINILSWLPAKSVLRFRVVCRGWRDLTSTHDFIELHRRRSVPMIFVSRDPGTTRDFFEYEFLDNWWEPQGTRLVSHRWLLGEYDYGGPLYDGEYFGLFSHGGLIVFEEDRGANFLIVNPTTRETVRIELPGELNSDICGVFFHPLLREYCILWQLYHASDQRYYYKMLNLGSKPCWRDVSNPWGHMSKIICRYPVLIGEYLYWLVRPEKKCVYDGRGDIMRFDIRSEKFNLIHCPVPSNVDCVSLHTFLLDIDGVLSVVLVSQDKKLVDVSIWKLKDTVQQVWVPMYHRIRIEGCPNRRMRLTAPAIVGEQLGLFLGDRFYVCDLKRGTTKNFDKKKYSYPDTFSHVMSLATLKYCKSKISVDEKGEVREESNMA